MAFWGVEVKPGKPFSHPPHSAGRLHVSQATLGFGTATKKSVVQCNVGNKSPVFLCSLFPEQSESCQLNVEFEEVDEVVFSVIGPRSVHLTGYYPGASKQYKLDDESESYGEDIVDTETERSDGVGDEDQYEDSFIDDDEDLQVIPSSPFSDGVNEELPSGGLKKDVKAKHRRLKKKYQSTGEDASEHQALSNGGLDIMDSECEDRSTIRSLVKSCARKEKTGAQDESEKDGGQTVATDSELNRKSHEDSTQPLAENDLKQKKKMSKKAMKEKEVQADEEDDFFGGEVLTWDKSRKNEAKLDRSSHDTALINADGKSSGNNKGENAILTVPPDDLINEIVAKTKKRKKKEKIETEVLGADKPSSDNAYTENQTQPDEAEKLEQVRSLKIDEDEKKANDEVKKAKTGKRKIKQGKEETALEAQLDEGSCENIEQGSLLEREDNQKRENDEVKKSKTGKRKHKQGKEEQVLGAETLSRENQAQLDEGSHENIEQHDLLQSEDNQKQANGEGVNMLLSDELVQEKVKKPGKRKKKQTKEEKVLEAENASSHLNGVDLTQHNEAGCENTEIVSKDNMVKNVEHQKQSNTGLQRPGVVIGLKAVAEPQKKRKKPAKDKALEADTNHIEILIDGKADGDEQNHKQTTEFDVDSNADRPGNENHNGKPKRKKSRVQENEEALNMDESTNTMVLDIEENDAKVKPKKVSRAKKK